MVRALLQCFKDYLNYAKVRKFVLLDYFVHFVLTWQNMCWGFEDGGMEMTRSAVLRSLSSQPSLLFSAPAVYHQNRQCRKDSKDIEACQWNGALKRFKSRLRTWKTLKKIEKLCSCPDSLCTNASRPNHSKARPLSVQMCSTSWLVNVLWHIARHIVTVWPSAQWCPEFKECSAMQRLRAASNSSSKRFSSSRLAAISASWQGTRRKAHSETTSWLHLMFAYHVFIYIYIYYIYTYTYIYTLHYITFTFMFTFTFTFSFTFTFTFTLQLHYSYIALHYIH